METKMRIKFITICLLNCLAMPGGGVLHAQFRAIETENLRLLYYTAAHEFVVPHIGRCFENALNFHSKLFDYKPSEQVTVLVQDLWDFGNAGASSIPKNRLNLAIAPYKYVYETTPANERMNSTMNHEVAHLVTMDKAAGSDRFFRNLFFGKVDANADNPISMFYSYLTVPRRYAPRWYLEGVATFMETWMAGGLGRTLGAYDEMVFRTKVRDNSYLYDILGLESEGTAIDFQMGANSYLYGTRFIGYLALKFSPENIVQWVSRSKGSRKSFSAQFKHVFGTSLADEWRSWIRWERNFQQANLDSIRLHPTTPFRPVSSRALGSVSRPYYDADRNKIYAAVRYPGQLAHIASIDLSTGDIARICNITGPTLYNVADLAYDPDSKRIFFTTNNNGWRNLNSVDLVSGKVRQHIKEFRTGDLVFNRVDQSVWGIRHYNGISTIVRIPPPHTKWNQIYSWPYGQDMYDIDISPDGQTLTGALIDISGNQKLIAMSVPDLMAGDARYEVLFDFENSAPANFVFTADGRRLVGSSYYSGVSNIYEYEFAAHDMNILSNCETGFFRPLELSPDSLLVMRYTGEGFVASMIPRQSPEHVSAVQFLGNEIAKKHAVVRNWLAGSPASVNIDSLTVRRGSYSTLGNISLSSAYPVVEGYKDFAAAGIRVDFADRLGLSSLDLTASYAPDTDLPDDEKLHLGLNLRHWAWRISANYNRASFYDLFGPTKASRKGYSLAVEYRKTLMYDQPKALDLTVRTAGFADLERLPDFQNVEATFDKMLALSAELNYEFVQKSLGAVDDEKGIRFSLTSASNLVNSEVFPRVYTSLDYGIPLPLNHSSVWLRSSIGQSFGARDNNFVQFFFGGFGNNYVDHLTEKRYREYYSFPGLELNEVGGRNYAKLVLEWNLPPLRFRKVGTPTFYLNWARFSLFSSSITTNFDTASFRNSYFNAGGQLDMRSVLFSHLPITLSFGFAAVVAEGDALADAASEFMFSLKIL